MDKNVGVGMGPAERAHHVDRAGPMPEPWWTDVARARLQRCCSSCEVRISKRFHVRWA